MAANNRSTLFLRGKVYWAKLLGAPRLNYAGDAKEWTVEFEPDEEGLDLLRQHKLTDRLKDKHPAPRGRYLVLRKGELNKDGTPGQPVRVYNQNDEAWDPAVLIGNGSSADVKLDVRDYGVGKKKGIYISAVRVRDLVPYVSTEFGGMDRDILADDEAPARASKSPKPKVLDDEIPF